jgi:hypothetical protein
VFVLLDFFFLIRDVHASEVLHTVFEGRELLVKIFDGF